MPDRRTHRGPHPEDADLFGERDVPALRQATADLSWLLGRGYTQNAALKLVGDHFTLNSRQRIAVARSACSDQQLRSRWSRMVRPQDLAGQCLLIDGYNILITLEAALGGAVLLVGRDGCIRDLASIHGTYRKVQETAPAIRLLDQFLCLVQPSHVLWVLDRPVSNSGRLKALILQIATAAGRQWAVELCQSVDRFLVHSHDIVATSDGVVLDSCGRWTNLVAGLVSTLIPHIRLIDLRPDAGP